MSEHLKAIKITDTVYWVGAIDWGVRNFHGYQTAEGTTYNAFLIVADKITLIDTVKHDFAEEMFSRISSVIDLDKIDIIVSNHAEPDHSGSLTEAIKRIQPEKVLASKMGVKALHDQFTFDMEITAVADGETLDLGNRTLTFIETKMLHWPDSMFSYINEEKFLFSQDAFGLHMASTERFDDETPWYILETHLEGYFGNILTLYAPFIERLFTKVESLGLEFKYIAPDHGPIWRTQESINKIFTLYKQWSAREREKKVVIIYDTMWKNTEKMARLIEDGIHTAGVKVKTMPLSSHSRSDVATEMLMASAVVVGSPTLNNNIFPSVADTLTYIKGLKFKTPLGASFGSYGWSGEAFKQISTYLTDMGTEIVGEVKTKYSPNPDTRRECHELGVEIARRVNDLFKDK